MRRRPSPLRVCLCRSCWPMGLRTSVTFTCFVAIAANLRFLRVFYRAWPRWIPAHACLSRSEEHTSELQSRENLVCRLLLEKKTHTVLAESRKSVCNLG